MSPSARLLRPAIALSLLVAAAAVAVGQDATTRIRGTIERVEGPVLTIATREGETVEVTLTPDAKVAGMVPADLGDTGPGSYIGSAAVPQPDGRLKAQEVLIFPEAMRGVGEGHRAWDLTPESTMTNATVEAAVSSIDGRVLTLAYKDGKQELLVPPGTPVVTLVPGDASLLEPGSHVFLGASQTGDANFTATRITVGKDGLVPPM
jgi:hypothetical protein